MGKKDACGTSVPVDQYRKQIGKQDYKKTKSALKATRLKADAKKNSSGFRVLGCSCHLRRTSRHVGTENLAAARAGCLGAVLVAGQSGMRSWSSLRSCSSSSASTPSSTST
ncbi:triple QxxK/R motif-containing protein isoform X1 [Anarhichas minor]|uniref:triple QxxK/R motif-containing protein isoform X1 n=1 Tax=Anarhichas minor TaxID=65739 RepID=UPI003F73AEAA